MMRSFLLSLALALAAASLPGTTALPSVGPSYAAVLGLGADLGAGHVGKTTKDKKKDNKNDNSDDKKKKTDSKLKVRIEEIEPVKRGKKNLEVHAAVGVRNVTCVMTVGYRDGRSESPAAITSDGNQNCVFRIDIPDRAAAIGTATATITAYTTNAATSASKSLTFEVR